MWVELDLIKQSKAPDQYGDLIVTEERRTVMAEEYSVGMAETYQAMAVGYKPETKFLLTNWLDYNAEEVVEYVPFGRSDPVRLSVLRTYRKGDALELTCYRGVDR